MSNEKGTTMNEKTHYKILFTLWLILGIAVMIPGNISRIHYFCVWVLLLLEYLKGIYKE